MKKKSILTPKQAGFRMPAEWEPHSSTWLAWPSHENLWKGYFSATVLSLGQIYSNLGSEHVDLLVPPEKMPGSVEWCLAVYDRSLPKIHNIPFGDIWLRDTGPIFLKDQNGHVASVSFAFNGWGRKYNLEHDDLVSGKIADATGLKKFRSDLIFEGGSIDVDGRGNALTTKECLLNPNRNPGLTKKQIEERLCDFLGLEKILWLRRGLVNDHTDGHVDNIARFVAPGVIACMEPAGSSDPNAVVLREIAADLMNFRDAAGRKFVVTAIPSPGPVLDADGNVMSASYLNFYIANDVVLVPTFEVRNDDAALKAIGKLFPGRRTIGIDSRALLTGGGTIHCITQQQPHGVAS